MGQKDCSLSFWWNWLEAWDDFTFLREGSLSFWSSPKAQAIQDHPNSVLAVRCSAAELQSFRKLAYFQSWIFWGPPPKFWYKRSWTSVFPSQARESKPLTSQLLLLKMSKSTNRKGVPMPDWTLNFCLLSCLVILYHLFCSLMSMTSGKFLSFFFQLLKLFLRALSPIVKEVEIQFMFLYINSPPAPGLISWFLIFNL